MRKLGPLSCLEAATHESSKRRPLCGILFHGYGADAFDLRSLSEVLDTGHPTNWIFPQGFLDVPIGPGWTGRAWWNLDIAAFERAALEGKPRDLSVEIPQGLPLARQKALAMIEALNLSWDQIVIGGFSQGAMLATDVFLHAPQAPRALVCFSGALLAKEIWKPLVDHRKGSPFFLSHGDQDMVLGHRGSAQLETLFIQSGMKGSLLTFKGGHEIPPVVIQKANAFLQGLE